MALLLRQAHVAIIICRTRPIASASAVARRCDSAPMAGLRALRVGSRGDSTGEGRVFAVIDELLVDLSIRKMMFSTSAPKRMALTISRRLLRPKSRCPFFRTKRDVRSAEREQPDIKRRSKEALITRLFEIDASPGEQVNVDAA